MVMKNIIVFTDSRVCAIEVAEAVRENILDHAEEN